MKIAPRVVTKKDEARLWNLQYTTRQAPTRRYAFRKGDTVGISQVDVFDDRIGNGRV
jgi:hypothetical protein